ncbi:MAG: hypothetical protein ACXW09_03675 [Methylococcaceae bacterium]
MFIYSLPIFFTHTGLATPVELLIMVLAVFIALFITSPLCEKSPPQPALPTYLFSAWSGSATLISVFWPFFVLLNGGLYAADTLAKTGLITVSSWDDIHIVLLLPIIWWTTGVWRCSANCQNRLWSASARLMTVGVFFEYSLKLLIRIDYPRVFFNCQEVLLDYGSCF